MAQINAAKGMQLQRNGHEYTGEWDTGEETADLKSLMNTLFQAAVFEVLDVKPDWVKLVVIASSGIYPGATFEFAPERLTDTYFRVIPRQV